MKLKKFFTNNGLSSTMLGIFGVSFVGQIASGFAVYNDELRHFHVAAISLRDYLVSGHFVEATFENWESEFLQMGLFVILTIFLYQKGSSESNPPPDQPQEEKKFPKRYFKKSPYVRKLYENSLGMALGFLFVICFILHACGGWREQNFKVSIGAAPGPTVSLAEFIGSSDFWFQSFQNWQSEFFSMGVMILLSIYLRQKGSAQSKQVDAPHTYTEK